MPGIIHFYISMKKLLFILPLTALLIQACSNDFEVNAPWQEIPVVYGILSPKDSAQYLRIEKAFLDPNSSALEIAQIADSIYYPENAITAYLERTSNGQKIQLSRVDGNLEGYIRDGGVFATQPNWLYKTKEQIIAGEKYRLQIVRADGNPDITAETTIPREFSLVKPQENDIPPRITFLRDNTSTVEWRSDVNGVYFTIDFRIRYSEYALNGSLIGRDTLYWTPAPNVKRTEQTPGAGTTPYKGVFTISSESFYRFLTDNITPANDRFRRFDGIDITLEGGGAEIERYLEAASANSGITGAEVVPVYTNLSEGFGIFTGKNRIILNKVFVTPETIQDMNEESPEKDLNFQ